MCKIVLTIVALSVLTGVNSDENDLKYDLPLDVSKEAMDIDIEYRKKGEPADKYHHMPGTTTLLNCDYGAEKWHCPFTVTSLPEADYDVRIVKVSHKDVIQIVDVSLVVNALNKYNSARLYMKPEDFAKQKASSTNKKYAPTWRMLAHDAPEHFCPQRVALTEYSTAKYEDKNRDHLLLLDWDIEKKIAEGYGENPHRGLLGYCAPAEGECGATLRLYEGKKELGTGTGGKSKKMKTVYGAEDNQQVNGANWHAMDCWVWPVK